MKMKRKLFLLSILFFIFPLVSVHASVSYPPLFGIQDDEMKWDSSLRSKAQEIGANWVRQYVLWSDIEPAAPQKDRKSVV
jgi:hypothetical protein